MKTDEKKADFDVVAHWRERAEAFRKQGNHGSAQFCDTHALYLGAESKRKKKAQDEADRIYAAEVSARVRNSFETSEKAPKR